LNTIWRQAVVSGKDASDVPLKYFQVVLVERTDRPGAERASPNAIKIHGRCFTIFRAQWDREAGTTTAKFAWPSAINTVVVVGNNTLFIRNRRRRKPSSTVASGCGTDCFNCSAPPIVSTRPEIDGHAIAQSVGFLHEMRGQKIVTPSTRTKERACGQTIPGSRVLSGLPL
jgi:hypothetical protein